MDNKLLIQKIKNAAQKDAVKRKDIRYKRAMGFLIKKGFLKTNDDFEKFYQTKCLVQDFIWAGKNVEPRILEVLPAAIARFPKAFIFGDAKDDIQLKKVIEDLRIRNEKGNDFLKIPYGKIKVWMNLSLKDKRTKTSADKKIMKSFRLKPETLLKIKEMKLKNGEIQRYLITDIRCQISE